MKKIFLGLAAIAALAACSKSEVEYESTGEITFTPVTKNITKSMMLGTEFETDENFNVWAFYNPTPNPSNDITAWVADYNGNTSKGAKVYIDEKPFEYHDSPISNWAGVTPYFWPKVGSLAFAGYYPTTQKANISYNIENNKMEFSNISKAWVNDESGTFTEDLMYFNITPAYKEGDVKAVFKHALSWLTVNLSTDETTLGLGATITVSSVKFTDVKPQGDGVVDNQAAILWTPKGTAAPVDVIVDAVVLSANANKQREPLFIPQTMAGNLEITYTVSSTADSEGEVSSFTETKVIELNTLKGWTPKVENGEIVKDDNDKTVFVEGSTLSSWDAGKHYTYNIVITTSEIIIDASVNTWEEVKFPIDIK